jgi:Mor family transcriptional regulator
MPTYTREELLEDFRADFRAANFPATLEARAVEIATDSILRRCQGSRVYFAKGRVTQSHRDRQILSAWDGHNQVLLAQKHDLSVRRVEQIIARQLRERKLVQRTPEEP